jgi:hypothetical protein
MHLPLPRAVGAYTVVRTTKTITTSAAAMLLGPFTEFDTTHNLDRWSNVCAIEDVDATLAINATTNAKVHVFAELQDASFSRSKVTPAAYSVQVLNGNALQTTSGVIVAGRARTVPQPAGSTVTWNAYMGGLSSYNQPRLMSAAKLALRGVQADLIPNNMAQLANFLGINDRTDESVLTYTVGPQPAGFAPLFISNPGAVELTLLVTCEWRVRFDPMDPAQATHREYGVTPDNVFANIINRMAAMGNGVLDIVERTAQTGEFIQRMAGAVQNSRRALTAGRATLALMG